MKKPRTKPKAQKSPPSRQTGRPTPVTIILPPRDYQPSKAEHEAEVDMPGASVNTVAKAFFRPVTVTVKAVQKEAKRKKR